MVVALVLRAWVVEMRSLAVKPRLLGGDLQLLATGPNHLRNFTHAFDCTHKHLEAMGARLAPMPLRRIGFENTHGGERANKLQEPWLAPLREQTQDESET